MLAGVALMTMVMIALVVIVMMFGSRDLAAVAVVMPRRGQRVGEQIGRQDQPSSDSPEHQHVSANRRAPSIPCCTLIVFAPEGHVNRALGRLFVRPGHNLH